jgi:hypothetical protein
MSRLVSRRALGLLATAIVAAAIAFPLGVIASHQFSDVPDSNTYHADIDALADAGVTTGCGDGSTFCPSAFVTREQMAAFMNRLGALGPGKVPVVNADRLDGIDSTGFLANETVNGLFTCSGNTMDPWADAGWTRGLAGSYATTATDAYFRCSVLLPDGATVTSADFEVLDGSATEHVLCSLEGIRLSGGLVFTDSMASAGTTNEETSGALLVRSDATITNPTIDNATSHYIATCVVTASGSTTAVYGVRIHYSVSGLPVP